MLIAISDVTVYQSIHRSSLLKLSFMCIFFTVFSFCDCIVKAAPNVENSLPYAA
jgi:hypothetical protein